MIAVLAPGQGAQTPGFLTAWLDVPGVADRLRRYSDLVGRDLGYAGTLADADELRDTALTQPLLVAAGLAVGAALLGGAAPVDVMAGHSVGEVTVAGLSGALGDEDALALVRERGRAMALASAADRTGMTAVLGGDPAEVDARLATEGLVAANRNGAGQVVAAGPLEALDRLAADPPAGARLRPLQVAGAFHTPSMDVAQDRLAEVVSRLARHDPDVPLVSNADGAVVTSGTDLLARLVEQVSRPVRWDSCMATLAAFGVTAAVELPPAGTLTGLLRRALPDVEVVALRSPDDLDRARAVCEQHTLPTTEPAPGWRVVVAPASGVFRPATALPGTPLAAGTPVGAVVSRGAETPVAAAHGGVLVEWLAEEGDPVGFGQPLARLHPESSA